MKKWITISIGAVFILTLCFILHAQETVQGGEVSLTDTNVDWNAMSDLEVELRAIESVPPMPSDSLPTAGTFWSAQHAPGTAEEWPPLPIPLGMAAWSLGGDGVYLLDDLNHVYPIPKKSNGATTTSSSTMMTMDNVDLNPNDGGSTNGGSGGSYSPQFLPGGEYGTNLWVEITNLTDSAADLMVSNTIADVEYEVQSTTNLADSQWNSEGFFFGSEITNWTPTSAGATNWPDLFYRIRSWQSSDGSGLPDWWELKYFGTTGLDPYSDPTSDGWTLLQDFHNGFNPTNFITPPTPQISVTYNASNGVATASWLPSPGPVTGYTINFDGTNYYVSSDTSNLTVNVPYDPFDIADDGPLQYDEFQIQSDYVGGNSAWSDYAWVQSGTEAANPVSAVLVSGSQGTAYIAASALPPGTVALRVTRVDYYADSFFNDSSFDTNFDIAISSSTNGLYPVPASLEITPMDSYGAVSYDWWVQAIDANDNPSAPEVLTEGYYYGTSASWLVPPFFDGRAQLKQNLIIQLRAATENGPFQFTEQSPLINGTQYYDSITCPSNYVYSGFYQLDDAYSDIEGTYGNFDVFLPFFNNCRYRNFVFDSSALNTGGYLTNGVGGNGNFSLNYGLYLEYPPHYEFQAPVTTNVTITALLATNVTRWLNDYPGYENNYSPIGISSSGSPTDWTLSSNARNYWGLQFLSVNIANALGITTLSAGNSTTNGGYFYPETAQPQFTTAEYDFWDSSPVPGSTSFSPTNQSDLLIAPVGGSIQVNGYAKLAVANAYSGVYGYLGQYFDKAYQVTNGIVTTNMTGVLSPYGNFFATQAGTAALVTMPDIDTGARGTCMVYCVSMNVDKNHDGNMDLSFNGPDATSQSSPMECWVNNGYILPGSGGNLDKDEPLTLNNPNNANSAYGTITCQRDLENFFRFWICGAPSTLSNLNYYATLSCTAISGSPAINLYYAETNGGIGYLTDTNIAAGLVGESKLATVSPSSPFFIPFWLYNGSNLHFLFEGAGIGEGQFTLTIYQGTNAIAQTSTFIDLHDIKDLYEQAHIAGLQNTYPEMINSTNASTFVSDHEMPSSLSESNQLVVFVHGWRMGIFDYQSFSDTMFKRLYWSGYHGRFASLRWPTLSKDDFWTSGDLLSYTTYNRSEYIAHRSADGASAYFDWLKSRMPDYSINAVSHSMGGIVMMEALKLQLAEGSHTIDNYVMMQAAVPAHCYDTSLADYGLFTAAEDAGPTSHTPDVYRGFPGNISTAVNGQIVNFFNTNDYALATGTFLTANVSWEGNEVNFKPDGAQDYYSDGTNCFQLFSRTVTDPREQMAFVARPRSKAAGALEGVAGQVDGGEVDLTAQYNFREKSNQHSAEFNWTIQQLGGTTGYYKTLLQRLFP